MKQDMITKQAALKLWLSVVCFCIMGRDPVELAKRAKYQPPAMRVRGDCCTMKSPFRL